MKKQLLTIAAALIAAQSLAQVTVSLKPGPTVGQDAQIMVTSSCQPWSPIINNANTNFGGNTELNYMDWTFNALGCGYGTLRSLIRFTDLTTVVPAGATITNAQLKLYGVPTSSNYGNSSFPGSPYGTTNEGWVQELDNTAASVPSWLESTVTWNTQPSIHPTMAPVAVPVTTTQWSFDASMTVTAMVQDMLDNGNNGFLVQLQNENIYRSYLFASSNHSDNTLWPELEITYVYCNPEFSYTVSTAHPNDAVFNADDPSQPGMIYDWYVNGTMVGSGPSFNYSFPGGGSYTICLYVHDQQFKNGCKQCIKLCIPDKNGNRAGITEEAVDGASMIKIYPNPAHDVVNIDLNMSKAGDVNVKMFDITGKEVARQLQHMAAGQQKMSVSTDKLANGIYIVEVSDGASRTRAKIVKD